MVFLKRAWVSRKMAEPGERWTLRERVEGGKLEQVKQMVLPKQEQGTEGFQALWV